MNCKLYKEFYELYHTKVSDIVTIKARKKRMEEIKVEVEALKNDNNTTNNL